MLLETVIVGFDKMAAIENDGRRAFLTRKEYSLSCIERRPREFGPRPFQYQISGPTSILTK